jgi:hypothetical protein
MTEDYAEIEELAIALEQESQLLRDLLTIPSKRRRK